MLIQYIQQVIIECLKQQYNKEHALAFKILQATDKYVMDWNNFSVKWQSSGMAL